MEITASIVTMKSVFHAAGPMMLLAALTLTLVGCSKETTAEVKTEPVESATAEVKPYPLDTCVVEDEKLGSMGDPYVFVHEGQELKLCCKGCRVEQVPACFDGLAAARHATL